MAPEQSGMAKASPGMKLDTTIWSVTGPWGARIDVTRGAVLFHILFVAILTGHLGLSVDAFVYPLMFALAVLWHEWGHEWSAQRQGLEVQRVALTFGGGFCETGGGDVRRVFWMVLMGPVTLQMVVSNFMPGLAFAMPLCSGAIKPE